MDCEEKGGRKYNGEEVEFCGKAGFDQGGRADGGEDFIINFSITDRHIFVFLCSVLVYLGRAKNCMFVCSRLVDSHKN